MRLKNWLIGLAGLYLMFFAGAIESIYKQNLWGCYILAIVSMVVIYKTAKELEEDI